MEAMDVQYVVSVRIINGSVQILTNRGEVALHDLTEEIINNSPAGIIHALSLLILGRDDCLDEIPNQHRHSK